MNWVFLALVGLLAAIDWLAIRRGARRVEFFTKPALLAALLGFVIATAGFHFGLVWLFAGLLFSLAGDILLLLPGNLFRYGLWTFLLTHLAYTIGFNPLPPFKVQHLIVAALIVLLVALPAVQVYRRIIAGLQTTGRTDLRRPVLIYSLALILMVVSALFTMLRGSWLPMNALAVSAGALLFLLSDTLLAWNRFVAPLASGRLWVNITYHLAQVLIALGATFQFLNGPAG